MPPNLPPAIKSRKLFTSLLIDQFRLRVFPSLERRGWLRHQEKSSTSESGADGWSLTRNVSPN